VHVGIIYSTEKKVIEKLAQGLAQGLQDQGHTVKLYADVSESFGGLAMCKHLFIGSYTTAAFKPRTPVKLRDALNKIPGLAGKRSTAFIARGGMGERKALVALMTDMEKQGCFIVDQVSFSSEREAQGFGKTVKLK
jgi:flavorubredoxin